VIKRTKSSQEKKRLEGKSERERLQGSEWRRTDGASRKTGRE